MTESSPFKPLLIRASAGTGKTYTLSSRYISLLTREIAAKKILATTFTRKAAGEIRERIIARIAEAGLNSKDAEDLAKDINLKSFDSPAALKLLEVLLKDQHRLAVSTMDSFFSQIARCFSYELNLPQEWKVANPATEERLHIDAVTGLCRVAGYKKTAELLERLNRGQAGRSVQEKLESSLAGLNTLFRETALKGTEIDSSAWNWIKAAPLLKKEELQKIAQDINQVPLRTTKTGQPNKRWKGAIETLQGQIARGEWIELIKTGLPKKVLDSSFKFSGHEIDGPLLDCISKLLKHSYAVNLGFIRTQTSALYELLKEYHFQLADIKLANNTLGFSDVKFSILAGIATESLEMANIYYRLDSQVGHLLLDEFQDTSFSEWVIVKPLVDEILSSDDTDHSFFCVGDTKQAIYGWRGGVAEIFDHIDKNPAWLHIKKQEFQKTWRCQPEIIKAVNALFSDISSNPALIEYQQAATEWQERFKPHESHKEEPGIFSCRKISSADDDSLSLFEEAAQQARELEGNPEIESVGILLRTNKSVARMIYELNRNRSLPPASEEGGNPLTDSPAVNAVLSLLKLIEHPGDTIAAYHVATSLVGTEFHLSSHESEEQILKLGQSLKLRFLKDGYGDTLAEICEKLRTGCSARDVQRLEQLAELGFLHDQEGGNSVGEFIDLVLSKRIESPEQSKIRVMTVHQSKGLGFDAVILPELDERLIRISPTSLMTYSENPAEPADKVSIHISKGLAELDSYLNGEDAVLNEIYENQAEGILKEALSVFYVAITRAKKALYLFISEKKPSSRTLAPSCAEIVKNAFEFDEDGIFESGSLPEATTTYPHQHDPSATPELRPVIFKTQSDKLKKNLKKETPSSLAASDSTLSFLYNQLSEKNAALTGTVIHKVFEQIEWLDEDISLSETGRYVIDSFNLKTSEIKEVESRLEGISGSQKIRGNLSPESYSDKDCDSLKVLREFPFIIRKKDAVVSGMIDRAVIGYKNEKPIFADIIDYKSDLFNFSDKQLLDKKIKSYQPQIDIYKEAICRLTGLSEEKVSGRLLFVCSE